MLTVSNFTCFDNEVANLVFLFFDFRAHFLNIFFLFLLLSLYWIFYI